MMDPIVFPRISDQKPLVTVISIAYNHEPYIRACLDGFLMQMIDFPVEFVIHDDASTDHTADILREYYEKRPDIFHVIIQRENQYSRGKDISIPLMEQAQGKYIAFCEGDDYWTDPLKLQKQFDFLEKNKDYIAVVHRYDVVNKAGVLQKEITFGYYREDEAGRYTMKEFENIIKLPSQLASLMFRNYNLDHSFVYPDSLNRIKAPGDMKLFFLLLLHGDIYRMRETMSAYRHVMEEGGGSWTSRQLIERDPYQMWIDYLDLESFAAECGKHVNLDKRKVELELDFIIIAFRKCSLSYYRKFFYYLARQKGACIAFPYMVFRILARPVSRPVLRYLRARKNPDRKNPENGD